MRGKFVHKLFAYVVIILSQYTLLLGMGIAGEAFEKLCYVHWVVVISVLLYFEIMKQKTQKSDIEYQVPIKMYVMSEGEFDQRIRDGEQLVIFEEKVLDISEFKDYHPGGAFVLDQSVGRDISKLFYGGYHLEGSVSPHQHEGHARELMQGLIIASLVRQAPKQEARIVENKALNASTKTVILESQTAYFQKYYSQVSMIGKHFVLRSLDRHVDVKRQYTVSNCMRPEIYSQYI